jgi:DNA-directed RNA polymerase subunit N (RpoN/RPB10)
MIKNIPDIICSVCGKVFKFESGMRAHMESHLKGKIKCFECGKQYASDWILNEHVATKHEGKSKSQCEGKVFLCDLCVKRFGKKSDMNWHINPVHEKI